MAVDFAERRRLELESAAPDVSVRRMFNLLKPLRVPAQHSAAGAMEARGSLAVSPRNGAQSSRVVFPASLRGPKIAFEKHGAGNLVDANIIAGAIVLGLA
eukprot:2543307-Pyramimonas_sp.AAC.1